jgi:hypothetical protein
MDKLQELKQKIETYQAKSVLAPELKAFATLILSVVKTAKENFDSISKENLATIQESIAYIEQEHAKQSKLLDDKTNLATGQFDAKYDLLKGMLEDIKNIKVVDGKDGKDGLDGLDGKDGKDGENGSPDEAEDIKEKLESLKDENRLDASAIKNLPEFINNKANGGGWRNLYQMHDVELSSPTDNQVLTYDSASNTWKNENSATGGISDGDKGDITVSASGATWTIDDGVVTFAKMQDIATNRILGRSTAGVGSIEALADSDARTIMGLATSDSPQFAGIELGHATQNTLTASAGVLSIEGTAIPKGTGTSNQIAYWSDTNVIGALDTTTYPSLTELTYVKGVTSAIQTQLNGKAPSLGADDNYVTDAQLVVIGNTSGTNTGDQTITNSSDATSHTVTLSASGGSVQLIEGSNITLTTGGTAGAGTVTIASTGGAGLTWGDSINSNSGTGLTVNIDNSSSADTTAYSTTIGNTQTQRTYGASINMGTANNQVGLRIINNNTTTSSTSRGIFIQNTANNSRAVGLLISTNFNSTTGATPRQDGGAGIVIGGNSTEGNSTEGITIKQGNTNYLTIWNNTAVGATGFPSEFGTSARPMIVSRIGSGTTDNFWSSPTIYSHIAMWQDQGSSNTNNFSTDQVFFGRKITNSHSSGTAPHNYNFGYFLREHENTNAGGTTTNEGTVLHLRNKSTQTLGTLTDTVDVLKLTQSSISTGNLINGLNESTTVFAVTKEGAIELGHATDTTITRESAGVLAVEGNRLPVASGFYKITVSATEPTSPALNDLWYDIS